MSLITFTTDFGEYDTYVAQMKAAAYQRNPVVTLIDVTHQVPRHDILRGAVVLDELLEQFPENTVHVVVVDPGVGSSRRIVVVTIKNQLVVAPDNGLFSMVYEQVDEVVTVDASKINDAASSTFHGRDLMAPLAAELSFGRSATEFGSLSKSPLVNLELEPPKVADQKIDGHIIAIDYFGNVTTNIQTTLLTELDRASMIIEHRQHRFDGLNACYSDVAAGELLALIGSSKRLELAVNQGNAAEKLSASIGQSVTVRWDCK